MTAEMDSAGFYTAARRLDSPHCDARPEGMAIELIVIHNISLPPGQFGGDDVCDFFLGKLDPRGDPFLESIKSMRVSAHFFVRRDGCVVQFVPVGGRAWHAGVSLWRGREKCNDFSIGIELEGQDDLPYDERQYGALLPLLKALVRHSPITGIAGHEYIAPGRKTDPGPAFDWPRLIRETGFPAQWFGEIAAIG